MGLNIKNATEVQEHKGTYLIYGPPGTGKTTSAKFFPGRTLVLDIDRTSHVLKGLENIDILEIDNINTWDSWEQTIVKLMKDYIGAYDNILIDNLSELERCILSDLGSKGKNKGVPSMGDYQYMQFKVVNSLRYLKNINSRIIISAWEETDLYTTAEGQQFNRSYPQMNGKILNNMAGLCDVVAKLTMNEENKRGFVLSPTNSIYAKNQIDDRKGCLQEELIIGEGEK